MGSVVCKAEQKTDFMFYIKLPFFLSSSTLGFLKKHICHELIFFFF